MRASSSDESEFVDDRSSMDDDVSEDEEASVEEDASVGADDDADDDSDDADNAPTQRKRRSNLPLRALSKPKRQRFVQLDPDMEPEPEDRVPRQRRSETWEMREEIMEEVEAEAISNQLPPFPIRESESWDQIVDAVEKYAREFDLTLRSRDSRLTTTHNSKIGEMEQDRKKVPKTLVRVPERFQWTFVTYRCTNGCYQKSRSTGERERKIRFRGCPARFTFFVHKAKCGGSMQWVISIKNETRTHNHRINAEIAASYATAKSTDDFPEVMETVADLVDGLAHPKNVAAFLADNLGRNVTPQQARNIIKRLQGNDSAEGRLRDMLDRLVQADENDAMILLDQIEVTCGVTIQSAIQKECFRAWGECIVMDWTHGTNNLGFHMGSLLVTSPTGRGIPVFDFIAVDEKAAKMTEILTFFKRTNEGWQDIKTFVIDKDFVEWRVLEACFPEAKVLLCQYHAVTYWKKLVQKRIYDLKVAQREMVEDMIIRMMKSPTETAYHLSYDDFSQYCSTECPDLLSYYDRNWGNCLDMWADYARGAFFSAGNTTTNRIEANWNQLKLLLGHRPRLDKTMAGVLSHHVAVIRQFMSVLRRHSSRTRPAGSVPRFLRSVAGRLSDYTFRLVKKQWDVLHGSHASGAITPTASHSEWEVSTGTRSYLCNVADWRCTCHFNISLKLPCRHVMLVVRDQLGLKALPDSTIPRRWCMRAAQSMYELVESCVPTVLAAVAVVKISGKLKAPGPVSAPLSTDDLLMKPTGAPPTSRVVYTRLHRRQKAMMVVLSPEEKYRYAYAVVAPLLDRLSNTSTPQFYTKLERLEGVVQQLLVLEDESDAVKPKRPVYGETSDLEETLDALDVMEMISTLDQAVGVEDEDRYLTYESPSQVSLPDLTISDVSQRIIEGVGVVAETEVANQAETDLENCALEALGAQSASNCSGAPAPKHPSVTFAGPRVNSSARRDVQVLRLPKGNTKKKLGRPKKTTQLRRTSGALAVQEWPTIPVSLPDLLVWALRHPNIQLVREVMMEYPVAMIDPFLEGREPKCSRKRVNPADYVYNFVVPRSLVDTMNRVLREERKHEARAARAKRRSSRGDGQSKTETGDEASDKDSEVGEIVVRYGANFKSFTSLCIAKLTHFYDLKAKARAWESDLRWIRRAWAGAANDVPSVELFAMETISAGSIPDATNAEHNQACANEIIAKYECSGLSSRFYLPHSAISIPFAEVVGYVARDCWLNDTCINMCVQAICSAQGGCLVFNSLLGDTTGMQPPMADGSEDSDDPLVAEISAYSYFVMPVNIRSVHWVVLIVSVNYRAGTMTVFYYDPQGSTCVELEDTWEEMLLPYIRRWHHACADQWKRANANPNVSNWTVFDFPKVIKVWLKTPLQPDGSSCGVMVIAQVYTIINKLGGFGAATDTLSSDYIAIMRLRTLWMLVCYMDQVNPGDVSAYKSIHCELAQLYGKKNSSVWSLNA